MIQLNEKYNREDFLDFLIKDFLPDFDKDIRPVNCKGLTIINEATYLGQSKSLDLYIFELSYSESHANKRVALATDGFRIMQSTATFNSLIVFNPQNKNNWRLSLMTATPEKNEKGGVSVHLSNPRRYSFELGENTKINTPYSFLIKKGKLFDLDDLRKRFSIEVVNKEFYMQIAELFTELVGGTRGEGRNQRKYPGIIGLPSVPRESRENHEFAVRLIGRLIFCWFLREKKSNSDLPLISGEILSLEAANDNPDYYHSILEPLFFEVLNKPFKLRNEGYRNHLFGKTPYLNGGLFTPQAWDYYDSKLHNVLKIPDDWIRKLFEVLELYNFTVDENTSVDIDLSIDPEMLGRIFENLLAEINPETGETARKSTGSYYTPRTIVDYMVDESLIQYLKDKTSIDEGTIRAIVSYDLNDDENYLLNKNEKDKLIESLSKITILDPACGSGAFPIGVLQKIVFILQRIDQDAKLWFKQQIEGSAPEIKRIIEREFAERNFDYIRKLGIIRQSIFGVDIQPIATEIARLRCFLTLVVDERVVDEEENRGIEPLPNLDFKFVTANSLIGLPSSQANSQVGLFEDQEGINKLKEVRDIYFNSSGSEREQLKLKFVQIQNKMFQKMIQEHTLAELTQKLSSWDPFGHEASAWFDSDWMFGVKEGFDIVIGNPPYGILNKKQNKAESIVVSDEELKFYKYSKYYEPAAGGMINIFRLFILRSIHLLAEEGIFSEIFPLAFIGDLSISKLRKYILDHNEILFIEAFPERDNPNKRVFGAVKMSVCILSLKKTKSESSFFIRINSDRFIDLSAEKNYLTQEIISKIDPRYYTFPLASSRDTNLLNRVLSKSIRFNQIGECNTGEVDMTFCKGSFTDNSKDAKLLKGAIIDRYQLRKKMSQGEIVFINEKILFAIKKNLPRNFKDKERIVMQGITGVNEPSRLKMMIIKDAYCANSLNYLMLKRDFDLRYLLGIFNSKLLNFFFSKFSTNSNVNGYEVDNLPIVIDNVFINPITGIVDKILATTKSDDYLENPAKKEEVKEYERQIDQLVYKLYELNPEEIKVVEGIGVNIE